MIESRIQCGKYFFLRNTLPGRAEFMFIYCSKFLTLAGNVIMKDSLVWKMCFSTYDLKQIFHFQPFLFEATFIF